MHVANLGKTIKPLIIILAIGNSPREAFMRKCEAIPAGELSSLRGMFRYLY
jgi:hypothetical protein